MKQGELDKKAAEERKHVKVNVIRAETCLGKGGGVRPTSVTHRK